MKQALALIVCFTAALGSALAQEAAGPAMNELEKKFQQTLTNAELVGSFSVVGKNDDAAPKKEKYHILKASKLDDEHWLIVAKWGKSKVGIPLRLSVKWAGDTPMIQLTDFAIPGMGVFSSRVLFYGDRYAGTWQHDEVGGHLWGEITPAAE